MSSFVKNSAILLSSLVEDYHDIITVKDINLNYLFCNKAFYDVTGIGSDVIGQNIKDVLGDESFFVIVDNVKQILVTGETQKFTLRLNDKIFTQTVTPIVENGVVSKFLSVSQDVTCEENLKLKLVEKICQFNTLLEHISMPVYMKDKNCNYIAGSKYARDFVYKGIDAYAGNIALDLNYSAEEIAGEDKYVIETKTFLEKERKARTICGDEQWYKIYKAPIVDGSNSVSGLVTIARNINNEKLLEAQKELFLATLTHDLKNPVQAQLMSLKMLNNGAFGELNSEQKEMLGMLIESANYMNEMLQSILVTYKFDNGVINLEKKLFNIESLLNNCINEVKALAKSKNINIVTRFDAAERNLNADENQLRRVISNLINNALNYSFKDSNLLITITNDKRNMIFSFENSSPEIPENIKDKIFEKYVSGAQSFKLTGIGLGLYFSKKVVEAHDGRIYLEGKGTSNKFIFEIPLANSEQASIKW